MDYEMLSLKEKFHMAYRLQQAAIRFYRQMLEHVDPADETVLVAVRDLLSEEEEQTGDLGRIEESTDWPVVWRLDTGEVARQIASRLPSLAPPFNGRTLDHAAALDRAERVEDELARFYKALARTARDLPAIEFFRASADRAEARARRLEQAVLV